MSINFSNITPDYNQITCKNCKDDFFAQTVDSFCSERCRDIYHGYINEDEEE